MGRPRWPKGGAVEPKGALGPKWSRRDGQRAAKERQRPPEREGRAPPGSQNGLQRRSKRGKMKHGTKQVATKTTADTKTQICKKTLENTTKI